MAKWQSAPFCDDCWDQRNPGKPSPRVTSGPSERCHGCGTLTRSGIYIKTDVEAEPAAPPEASRRFISSVGLVTRGAHKHVTVFVRGRNVGTLVCGLDEGGPLASLIECCNFLNLDKSGLDKGDPTGHERFEWAAMAANWLDVREIAAPEGFVGRIVLRLLRALELAEKGLADADAVNARSIALLREAGPALSEGAKVIRHQVAAPPRAPDEWLIKDFNVLYRAAKRFADACHGRGQDGEGPYPAQKALDAQLERLRPAYTLTETVRDRARETGRVEPAPPDALESYERTKRSGEGD